MFRRVTLKILQFLILVLPLFIWCSAIGQEPGGAGRSNVDSLVQEYRGLLIFMLIAFTLLRSKRNRITYNKLHNTSYFPGIHKFNPDNNWINFMCLLIFWWPIRKPDGEFAKDLKRKANRVSFFSTVIVVLTAFVLIIF